MKYLSLFILSFSLFSCGFIDDPASFQMTPEARAEMQRISEDIEKIVIKYVDQGLSEKEIRNHIEALVKDLEDDIRRLMNDNSNPPFSMLPSQIREPFIKQNLDSLEARMKFIAKKLIQDRNASESA